MTHEELDEFVTDQTLVVKERFENRFGYELPTSKEQEISDHLWFVFCNLTTEAE
jgi:hypothetical protein